MDWTVLRPRAAWVVGRVVFVGAGLLLALGLLGRAMTAAISLLNHQPAGSLSALYPQLPTAMIPETASGFALTVTAVLLGFVLAWQAKRNIRLLQGR